MLLLDLHASSVQALAGMPRKVTTTGLLMGSPPQWSPDGTEIACVAQDTSGFFVKIVSLRTGESRRLQLPGRTTGRLDLSWSPDGRYFAYVDAPNVTPDLTQLWVLRVVDGKSFPVTDGRNNDWSPSWSPDGRTLYFVSNRDGSMDFWQQLIKEDGRPVGSSQQLTTGIGIRHAVLSPDGTKLAYAKGRLVANLWRVPNPTHRDRSAIWADAQQLTFDQVFVEQVNVLPDGKRLLFDSDRMGNMDIWMIPVEGGEMQQVTTDPTPDWAPAWSPDGKQIAFHAARSGNRDIWVMPVEGGPARQVTGHEASDMHPVWSPDGQEIAFTSARSGNADIWVIPTGGGEARQITVHLAIDFYPQWSPDGEWLIFTSNRTSDYRLWRVPTAGGIPEPLTEGPAGYSRWSPDGKRIYFVGTGMRAGTLWTVLAEGGNERPLTDFSGKYGVIGIEALATDGQQLYFTWAEDLGDLWVMDVITEDE